MRTSVLIVLGLVGSVGCAQGSPMDAGFDAARDRPDAESIFRDAGPDAGPVDAGETDDAGPADGGAVDDAGPMDGGALDDAGLMDGGSDAGFDAGGSDAGPTDAGIGTCPSLDVGHTLSLDGAGDLAKFSAAQRLLASGSVGAADEYGITWDRDYLYVALTSPVFADGLRPLHVYLEVRASLGSAMRSVGKEYDGLTPQLPFTATHVIAVRRTSASGGPAYNGVYTPGAGWTTLAMELRDGVDVFSEGTSVVSVRVPWSLLGCASAIRLTSHVVNGPVAGNEWKDFVPSTTEPWMSPGGGYYEIDLTADPAVTGWSLR